MPAPPTPAPTPRPKGYDQALEFLYGRIDYERANRGRNNYRFRLRCTAQLFERLGLGRYLYRGPHPDDDVASDGHPGDLRTDHNTQTNRSTQAKTNFPPVPLVHIAGTKGKGSTATMISAILTAAGRRVGLYTSPHLTDLEERFRIDGVPCDRGALVELVETVRPVVTEFEAAGDPVSFFELTTAMAILHFERGGCDAIVLEVGLGGRLDSTNVCASSVTAVTSIGLDHQHVLGNTIAEIAAEKAGIIKPGIPVVCGATKPDAIETIAAVAKSRGAPFFLKGDAFTVQASRDFGLASELVFRPLVDELAASSDRHDTGDSGTPATDETYTLALAGAHQVDNAGLAIAIARLIGHSAQPNPIAVRQSAISEGLRNVRCIGRLERFLVDDPAASPTASAPQIPSEAAQTQTAASENLSAPMQLLAATVQVILDTAHNEDSITALCQAIHTQHSAARDDKSQDDKSHRPLERPVVVVFGTSRDKDADAMARQLAEVADEVICTRYTTNPRAYEPQALSDCFPTPTQSGNGNEVRCNVRCQAEPFLALREAIREASPGGTVVVCGSFFLAGQLRPLLLSLPGVRPIHFETSPQATSPRTPDHAPKSTERSQPSSHRTAET